MTSLRIAPGLELDADYIGGGTLALLAKKGAGKSYTARVLAEEMWKAKIPFVFIDPMGTSWGLRAGADGDEAGGLPVDYPAPAHVGLTAAGREISDPGHVPTTSDELHGFVFALVGPAKARILQALIEAYPDSLEREELAGLADASATSSGYANNLGNLRSLGLLDYPDRGYVVASPLLFV